MIINHNMASLNTYRQMSINETNTQKSLQKLSSGLRINSAADDAAGLAISEKMRGQIRGLDQASRNAQDGISLISTAEGALNETHSILQRMRELSVQSSNDTSTDNDRAEMQKEVSQLKSEIDRIGNTTEFNTKKLLDGAVGAKLSSNATTLSAVSSSSNTKSGVYAVAVSAVATHATLNTGTAAVNNFGDNDGGGADVTDTDKAITAAGTMTLNGTNINLAAGDTIDKVVQKINNYTEQTGVKAIVQAGNGTGQKILLQSTEFGSDATISAQFSSAALSYEMGYGGTITNSAAGTDVAGTIDGNVNTAGKGTTLSLNASGVNADGLAVKSNVNETAATTTLAINGTLAADALTINNVTLTSVANSGIDTIISEINSKSDSLGVTAAKVSATSFTLTSTAVGTNAKINLSGAGFTASSANTWNGTLAATGDDGVSTSDVANITVSKDNVLKMQIGANQNQTMDVDINDMRTSALKIDDIDISTQTGAEAAIAKLDTATATVSSERSKLGAFQNRLEHTIANLGTSSENLTSAESRIRDVDMAKEMMNFQKNNILQQAAQAMLAQANQQPQGVLQLLR